MWIFNFLPETVFHLMLMAGVIGLIAGFFLGFVPLIDKYRLPVQIISLALFSFGLYLEGGIANEKEWQLKAANAKVKAAQTTAEGTAKTAEVQTQVVEKIKVIHEKGKTITEYVDRVVYKDKEVIKYIEKCPTLPQKIIEVHNKAADNIDVSGELK